MIGYIWDPKESMMTLKYFLADSDKHKAIVHQLDFIREFLQANFKHIVFMKLDIVYGEYLSEY